MTIIADTPESINDNPSAKQQNGVNQPSKLGLDTYATTPFPDMERLIKTGQLFAASLKRWQVSDITVRAFQLEMLGGRAMAYPLLSKAGEFTKRCKVKSLDGLGKKYSYPKNYHPEQLYFLPNMQRLRAAVSAKRGQLILVESEKDVWALHSAGITNAVATMGDKFKIERLIGLLETLGNIVQVIGYPHLDKSGEKWLSRVAEAARVVGAKTEGRQLPAALGNGGDIADLWARLPYARGFIRELDRLPILESKPLVKASKKPQQTLLASPENCLQAWIDTAFDTCLTFWGASRAEAVDNTIKLCHPFKQAEKQAVYANLESRNFYIFHPVNGIDGAVSSKTMLALLGLEHPKQVATPKAAPTKLEVDNAARLYGWLYGSDIGDFTLATLSDYLKNSGFKIRRQDLLAALDSPYFEHMGKQRINGAKKPSDIWRIQDGSPAPQISGEMCLSISNYRAALMRAQLGPDGSRTYSYKEVAKITGLPIRSIARYAKIADIPRTRQFEVLAKLTCEADFKAAESLIDNDRWTPLVSEKSAVAGDTWAKRRLIRAEKPYWPNEKNLAILLANGPVLLVRRSASFWHLEKSSEMAE